MIKILNLTRHEATEDQIKDGVIEPSKEDKETLKRLLTFEYIPTGYDIAKVAKEIVNISKKYDTISCMIGGPGYLLSSLERELKKEGKMPLYSFTKRVIQEEYKEDGTVVKTGVFKHIGFVSPP